jgi:antitoxin component of RelBE/YafQ-DinJ toxin-antitoxin module
MVGVSMTDREQINMRLDKVTAQRLVVLARRLGLSQSGVLRLAVAEMAEKRGVKVPAEEAQHEP